MEGLQGRGTSGTAEGGQDHRALLERPGLGVERNTGRVLDSDRVPLLTVPHVLGSVRV